jgi:hypothetical protein
MGVTRLIALGSLAVTLAACGATASLAPGAGADSTAPLPSAAPASAAGGASASAAPAGSGSTIGGGLADTPTAKMCTLLSADEAKALLGKDLSEAPNGVYFKGLGTNCIYQDEGTMAPATFIKVEINPVSYKTNAGLLTLGGGTSSTVTVGGLEATAVDVGGIHTDAGLVIKLSDGSAGPSMLIQAPTLDIAKAVAEKVIPRLATLK